MLDMIKEVSWHLAYKSFRRPSCSLMRWGVRAITPWDLWIVFCIMFTMPCFIETYVIRAIQRLLWGVFATLCVGFEILVMCFQKYLLCKFTHDYVKAMARWQSFVSGLCCSAGWEGASRCSYGFASTVWWGKTALLKLASKTLTCLFPGKAARGWVWWLVDCSNKILLGS